MTDFENYKLTGSVTVGQLQSWIADKSDSSKNHIIDLIEHRFENRYLKHMKVKEVDSGFLIMAVCCFVIETLQSFREGVPDTNGKGKRMFKNFFNHDKEIFPGFYELDNQFYTDIRCGILHQSETKNAWRILRGGKLLDTTEYSINARLFIQALDKSVNKYLDELRSKDFGTKIWDNAILKLEDVCENCKRT